ncbi:MAG: hypothetical protein AB8F95_15405 [Bacteroidia bacterium]
MNKLLTILSITLLFASCYSIAKMTPVKAKPERAFALSGRFLDIPLPPHNRKVDIMVPGEILPDSMVLPVRLVEVQTGPVSLEVKLNMLAKEARKQGMDGVILSGSGTNSAIQTTSGIGFIYEHNLDLISLRMKAKIYEAKDARGDWQEIGTVDYDMRGNVADVHYPHDQGRDRFAKTVHAFDIDVIEAAVNTSWLELWTYPKVEYSAIRRLKKRRTLKSLSGMATFEEYIDVKNYFDLQNRLVLIDRVYARNHPFSIENGGKVKDRFEIKRKRGGVIDHVTIQRNGNPHHIQRFERDERGRLESGLWSSWLENGEEHPFIRISYDYYNPSDYMPALEFAPDIPMRASRD